jgi:hypothetical protein
MGDITHSALNGSCAVAHAALHVNGSVFRTILFLQTPVAHSFLQAYCYVAVAHIFQQGGGLMIQ